MRHACNNAADTMFGHLFREAQGNFLFVRELGMGASCRTSLVHPDAGGDLVVRKALHGRVNPGTRSLDDARAEYENDVATARKLNDAGDAANVALRIPRLLPASAPATAAAPVASPLAAPMAVPVASLPAASAADADPVNPPASYWSLCNGGSMYTFITSCREAGAVVPCGLVLHFLQQLLETLDFMYTGLEQPIVHRDLHENNMLLHFTSGRLLPDVHVIDFGRAVPMPGTLPAAAAAAAAATATSLQPGNTRCCSDPSCTGDACPGTFWDVHAVLRCLRDSLLPLVFPPDTRDGSRALADERARHKYLLRRGKAKNGSEDDANDADADDDEAAMKHRPLHRAYQLLHAANAEFIRNLAQARRRASTAPSGVGSGMASFPSLQPALSFVRAAAAHARPALERNLTSSGPGGGGGGKHAVFCADVLEPARRAAARLSASIAGLLLLEGGMVPGATHAAEVDVDERGGVLGVRRVLAGPGGREREHASGRYGGGTWREGVGHDDGSDDESDEDGADDNLGQRGENAVGFVVVDKDDGEEDGEGQAEEEEEFKGCILLR